EDREQRLAGVPQEALVAGHALETVGVRRGERSEDDDDQRRDRQPDQPPVAGEAAPVRPAVAGFGHEAGSPTPRPAARRPAWRRSARVTEMNASAAIVISASPTPMTAWTPTIAGSASSSGVVPLIASSSDM